jgi:hypothetical protein
MEESQLFEPNYTRSAIFSLKAHALLVFNIGDLPLSLVNSPAFQRFNGAKHTVLRITLR